MSTKELSAPFFPASFQSTSSLLTRAPLLVGGIVACLLADTVVGLDRTALLYEWPALWLWLGGVLAIFLHFRAAEARPIGPFDRSDLATALGVLALSGLLHGLFLGVYPFNLLGDALRDGGLDAAQIALGKRRDLFAYGRYESHGLIIPTLNSFFYRCLGPTHLVFKLSCALIATVECVLAFFLARAYLPPLFAAATAMVLATIPLHLFYARTETVVCFNSFWGLIVFFALARFLACRRQASDYVRLGLLFGFVSNFHAAVRATCIDAFGLILLFAAYDVWRAKAKRFRPAGYLGLFLVFFLIGFGPRLWYTPWYVFLKAPRVPLFSATSGTFLSHLLSGLGRWGEALGVYLINPTTSHFPSHQPILRSWPLIGFFAIGVLSILSRLKNPYCLALAYLGLMVPLTNSALTYEINMDHRLTPLLPLIALFCVEGMAAVVRCAKGRRAAVWAVLVLATAGAATHTYRFFSEWQAEDDVQIVENHLLLLAVQAFQQDKRLADGQTVCFAGNDHLHAYLNFMHVQEDLGYLLPGKRITLKNFGDGAPPNSLYIAAECPPTITARTWRSQKLCGKSSTFVCPGPKGKDATLQIYISDGLTASR